MIEKKVLDLERLKAQNIDYVKIFDSEDFKFFDRERSYPNIWEKLKVYLSFKGWLL